MVARGASLTAEGSNLGGIRFGEPMRTAASGDNEDGGDRETVDEYRAEPTD
jgi:hypothetical protein